MQEETWGRASASPESVRKAKAFPINSLSDIGLDLTNHNSVTHPSLDASAGKVRKIKHQQVPIAEHISNPFKTEILLAKMKEEWLCRGKSICHRISEARKHPHLQALYASYNPILTSHPNCPPIACNWDKFWVLPRTTLFSSHFYHRDHSQNLDVA